MDIRKDIIDKYLNTKKNRLIAGCVTGLIVLGCGGGIVYATRDTSPKLHLKKNTINLEYGKEFKTDFDTLVDTRGLNKEDKEYLKKNLKIKTDIKNDIETVTNEDGTTEEKDRGFAKVGDYKVNLTYKDETKTVKVVVKDTTAPEMTVPENIEILQGTDLTTFDFKSLITITDLAQMELNIDYSTINVNVPMEYIAKANVEDVNGNKNEKEFKVTVIAPPIVAEDEVVVQETVTNADGTKTVKNTVKKKADSSGNKVVSSGFIGIGCGLVVRQGASCAGDDALALVISKITGWGISRAYLFTDLTVLVLSLSYIPVKRIIYSLITVTISSYLIDFITNFGRAKENTAAEA